MLTFMDSYTSIPTNVKNWELLASNLLVQTSTLAILTSPQSSASTSEIWPTNQPQLVMRLLAMEPQVTLLILSYLPLIQPTTLHQHHVNSLTIKHQSPALMLNPMLSMRLCQTSTPGSLMITCKLFAQMPSTHMISALKLQAVQLIVPHRTFTMLCNNLRDLETSMATYTLTLMKLHYCTQSANNY